MPKKKLTDTEAKDILRQWPTSTQIWDTPDVDQRWLQAQPRASDRAAPGPKLAAPGSTLFSTQPDGMWVYLSEATYADVVAVEVCGTNQNFNDKRSRYAPLGIGVVLRCSATWLLEQVRVRGGVLRTRWEECGTFGTQPQGDIVVPVRHLRVVYALPNDLYDRWKNESTPSAHEYLIPHSSLGSYRAQKMQKFLRQLSPLSHFYR